jgi:hypothetical protein
MVESEAEGSTPKGAGPLFFIFRRSEVLSEGKMKPSCSSSRYLMTSCAAGDYVKRFVQEATEHVL